MTEDAGTEIDPELQERINELTQSNGERLQRLEMHKIRVDMQSLMMRHLIEILFPTPAQQAEVNLDFQEKLDVILRAAEDQIDKVNLQRSVAEARGLYVPNQG